MNRRVFVLLFPIVLVLGVFVAGIAIHPAHALTAGSPLVCLVDPGTDIVTPVVNGCPVGNNAFTGPPTTDVPAGQGKAQLRVNVNVNNTLPMNGWDIILITDPTVLKPFDADLSTNTVGLGGDTISTLCIAGNSIIGSCGSQAVNLGGSLELGVGGSAFSPANATGVLFTAIYDIVGNVAAGTSSISFQTGCGVATSSPPTCITLTSGGSAAVPIAAAQTATYATSAAAITPFYTISSTAATVQVVVGGSAAAQAFTVNFLNGYSCGGVGCVGLVTKAAPAVGQPTTTGITVGVTPAPPYCDPTSCAGAPGNTFSVTVSTSGTVALGTYFVTLEGGTISAPAAGAVYLDSSFTFTLKVVDFSISVNPTSLSLIQGSPNPTGAKTGSSVITVTSLGGAVGTVVLACSAGCVPPATTTAVFNATSVALAANGVKHALVRLTPGTTLGAITVTIRGTLAGASHTTNIAVTVLAATDYYLNSTASPVTALAGAAGTTGINVVGGSSSTGTVSLSVVSISPSSGLSCQALGPVSQALPAGGTSTLSCTGSTATTFSVTVNGVNGATTHSTTVSYVIQDFAMSSNAPSTTGIPGQDLTVGINAQGQNGFTGTIDATSNATGTISCFYMPPSMTIPPTIASTLLHCTATVGGAYVIRTTGTDHGTSLSHTVDVTFVIQDFSITANPASVTTSTGAPGGSSTVTVTSIQHYGAPSGVAVSLSSTAPTGINCALSKKTAFLNDNSSSSVLTCQSASAFTNAKVNVTATSGSLPTRMVTVLYTIGAPFDYSLSNNGPVSIQQGSSGTVTITATLKSGTATSVTLSCVTPLPAGITCTSFNPPSVTPSLTGASSILTIAVASSVAPGSHSIQVTGAPLGATTTPTTVSITVTPIPFDYSLSNNGPVSITRGTSGSVMITATLTTGTATPVTLSCSGLPAGITCGAFTVNPVTPTGSSGLTVNVASTVASGSYTFQVTGSPVGATASGATTTVTVTVPKSSPGISSTLSSTLIDIGHSANDLATFSGGFNLSGTVTYTAYSDPACSTLVFTSANVGLGLVSNLFTPSALGTYFFIAAYNGDANNNAIATTCGAPGETLTVQKGSPSISSTVTPASITLGGSAADLANVQGGSSPTGTVTYTAFSDSACSTLVFTSANIPLGTASAAFTPSATGTYFFIAKYNGDANNNVATTVCGAPGETLTVQAAFDYSLSNNGPVSIQQGSSGTVTITATLKAGTAQSVTLSCVTPLPSGITCTSFNPPSVTPSLTGATSVLTIAVASSVAPGPQSVQVTGAPLGSTTTPTTVSITVTAIPFDYSLSNNGPVSIQQGSSGTVTITATLKAGAAQSVTLSCVTPLPSGITCTSFNPPSVTPSLTGASSVLTIAVASSVAAGPQTVQVTGTPLGATTTSTTVSITVTSVPFDYSLSNNGPVSIQQGSSGTVTITATLKSGTAQSVTLSCVTPLPTGITCTSFIPPSITPSLTGTTSILTIAVASSVAPGSSTIMVTGAPLGTTTTPTTVSMTITAIPFDYSLSNNGPVSIQQGSSGTVTITATLKAGAGQSVTLSCVTPLPSGITCTSFNPPSVTPSSTGAPSVLTIAVASSVAVGSHTIQVTGSPLGATTAPTTVSITVTSVPFDYSLSNNGPVSIQQGSSGTVTITATLKSGTAQSVTLSCVTPLPTGITCTSFNPPSVTPSLTGVSSVLTIAVASSVAPGSQSVQVTGAPLGATTTPTTVSIMVTAVPFDYSLSNNGPVSIQQGSSGIVTITATLKAGTAQSVTLSCVTPLPSGITCTSFNPPSVTPSSTGAASVLTISVASSVATGPQSIQITGSPLGATTTPTTVSITVTSVPFDYSLSNNGPVSILQGSSGTVTITTTLKSGTGQSVTLSCVTPLPSGISCTMFNPPAVTTGASSVLTFSIASSVAAGSYSVQVTGTPLGATTTPTTVSITVTAIPFDYSLSNNGPVSIQQGSSGTVTITATLKAGTAQSVALSCVSPLPSGITCTSFNPPSVTPSSTGATSVLTIAVASSVAPGSYSVQVTGSPAGATLSGATTTVSITVTAAPFDFSLSTPSPNSLTVTQGGTSGSSSITATLTSGSASSVTLSASGQPSGVTPTFTNNPCSPTCTVTVSFAASATATTGTFTLTISASGGGASHSTTLSLVVTSVTTAHATQTNVNCSPGSVVVNTPTTCSARVIDTSTIPTTPTGIVSFTTNSTGTFSPSPPTCTLVAGNSPAMATCSVTYTPTVTGRHMITGSYLGDLGHSSSSGSFNINVRSVPPGKTTLTFAGFDLDDFENGLSQFQVVVNGQVVADIPAGVNQLTGSGDFQPYDDVWVNFGPFDITSFVVQGQNTIVIRDPQTSDHFGRVRNLMIMQGDTLLLNASRNRGIYPGFTVTYTFSNPPLVLTGFGAASTTFSTGQSVGFTASFTGGTGPFKCIFRFGDNSSAVVNSVDGTCATTHTFDDPGNFTARVIIIGASTSDTVRGTLPLTIAN